MAKRIGRCDGCDINNVETWIVRPCCCYLCQKCYTESVEENDLVCVGTECPFGKEEDETDEDYDQWFNYYRKPILKECMERGYPLGSIDDVYSILKTPERVERFKEILKSRKCGKLEKFRYIDIYKETEIYLDCLGIGY